MATTKNNLTPQNIAQYSSAALSIKLVVRSHDLTFVLLALASVPSHVVGLFRQHPSSLL